MQVFNITSDFQRGTQKLGCIISVNKLHFSANYTNNSLNMFTIKLKFSQFKGRCEKVVKFNFELFYGFL